MKFFVLCAVILMLTPLAVSAQVTGCWDFWYFSSVTLGYPGPDPVSLVVVPDGSGDPLSAARRIDGSTADATITLTLNDCNGQPIANFPFEDLWLESADGGLVTCLGGSVADSNTDPQGMTIWQSPLQAGGHSEAGCYVVVNGQAMPLPALNLAFNSPDLNGDRVVNLSDVALFAGDFQGPYRYRSDFAYDGVLNLSDLVIMSGALGAACP